MPLEPSTAEETAECVRAHPSVLAAGAQTKPRLSEVPAETQIVSTRRLAGITEYDPSEFTFTALAGTPAREIAAILAAQGQYLPFDPMLAEAGATLGGIVASGLNGPGRFRYGGIRDFILAVQFVDGTGRILRGGAKVVKNAAGFDIPKFLVGSLGRYGILTELTFKVFPRPAAWTTVCAPVAHGEAGRRMSEAARGRWEIDAMDYDAHEGLLHARIGGPPEANAALAEELVAAWPRAMVLAPERAEQCWREAAEFGWVNGRDGLLKVPITPRDLAAIYSLPGKCRVRISGAGSCAWVAVPSPGMAEAAEHLRKASLTGMTIRGAGAPLFTAPLESSETRRAVRRVFDPEEKFAAL